MLVRLTSGSNICEGKILLKRRVTFIIVSKNFWLTPTEIYLPPTIGASPFTLEVEDFFQKGS